MTTLYDVEDHLYGISDDLRMMRDDADSIASGFNNPNARERMANAHSNYKNLDRILDTIRKVRGTVQDLQKSPEKTPEKEPSFGTPEYDAKLDEEDRHAMAAWIPDRTFGDFLRERKLINAIKYVRDTVKVPNRNLGLKNTKDYVEAQREKLHQMGFL